MINPIFLDQRQITFPALDCRRNCPLCIRHLYMTLLTIIALLATESLASSAELFPYSPPSAPQQRSMIQRPNITPELSAEERGRIEDLSVQAKKLSGAEQQQLRDVLRKNLESAARTKNWAQVKYYSEALRQIE
ncbi:MAG TPA: hypothetical protein PKD12_12740 [Nitrospira sp.]|nr:hypothetical protein [Nitrospira sp.]